VRLGKTYKFKEKLEVIKHLDWQKDTSSTMYMSPLPNRLLFLRWESKNYSKCSFFFFIDNHWIIFWKGRKILYPMY
jgi:hypothetical protein